MKKKISRILGVVLTLVLLSSLAVTTAVPVSAGTQAWSTFDTPSTSDMVLAPGINAIGPMAMASDGTIYAAVNGPGILRTQTYNSTGTAVWSTGAARSGSYSALLGAPPAAPPTGAGHVVIPYNAPLSTITDLGFWYNLRTGNAGTNNNSAPYLILALDTTGNGAIDTWLVHHMVELTAFNTWMQWTLAGDLTLLPANMYGQTNMWHDQAMNDYATWATVQATFGAATVLEVKVAVGEWASSVLTEEYVDNITINGVTYDLEAPRPVKSIDGGRTWTSLVNFPAISGPAIMDIVVSSINDNTVYVTDGIDIWRSDDAGISWSPRTNLFTFAASAGWPAVGFLITSIDIGYIGTNSHIFAGVSSFGGGNGGVFVCYEWQFGMPWNDLGVDNNRPTPWAVAPPLRSADVYDVRVDPNNFTTSQMVMAVATDTTANITYVTCHYDGAMWNSFQAGDAALNVDNAAPVAVPVTSPYRAQLWLPGNFDSSLASGLMEYHVSIAELPWGPGGEGDVYWILGSTVATGSTAIDLNVRGVGNPTNVTGLDGIGNVGTATLMAAGDPGTGNPNVYTSINNGATWTPNIKRPTGGTGFLGQAQASIVMLGASDALVATGGADCGVSLTNDGGAIFNTISQVATVFTWIDDMESGSLFITTYMAATNQDVWRHDGTNWERVFASSIYTTAITPFYLIDASAAGDAVFLVELGGNTITSIWRSLNDGQTWANLISAVPGAINSFVAIDANTVLVGGAGVVYQTTTNGAIWFTRTCTIGTVQSFDVASNGDILAGSASGAVGTVALSTDNGITWSVATNTIAGIDATGPMVVAFGYSYATTGEMYATGQNAGADAGVWKRTTGAWSRIDNVLTNPQSGTDDVDAGTGLVSAPGISGVDMVYAADGSATTEGVYRIKSNRTEGEQMAGPANTTFWGLWYTPGSNKLYTLDRTGAGIGVYTFTDTLAVVVTGVAVSAITPTTATVTWNALTNATNYLVVVNTTARTNFYTAVNTAGVLVNGSNANAAITANTASITGLLSGVTYNVSVWSWATESSFLGADAFTTLPTPPVAPANLVPANGAINIPILGPAFAWAPPAVVGITGYNWELTQDPTFATITEGTASPAVPYLVWPEALDYETAYYWRVQAVTAAGTSAWVTSVFTTVAEAEPPVTIEPAPTPTITVIQPTPTVTVNIPDIEVTVIPPDITVDIPQPTITTVHTTIEMPEEVTPAYIWAIVAIGALLVIAVIILIIRTRRVV